MLTLLADECSVADIATATPLNESVAAALIDALIAGGVVEANDGEFRLTPDWHAVTSTSGARPLRTTLDGERVGADLLRHIAVSEDYWNVSSDERVAMAASLSPDPIDGAFVDVVPALVAAGAPLATAASTATRYLELGCGVAGTTLSFLQVFPRLTVVGVELSDDLATEAERRAKTLGVEDRISVVRCDAAEFSDPEPFDVGFWSQFFFPEPSRTSALRTLFASVRSGGLVAAPVVHARGDEAAPQLQRLSLLRVTTTSWGIPDRTPEALADELTSAGFTVVRVVDEGKRSKLVVATRP